MVFVQCKVRTPIVARWLMGPCSSDEGFSQVYASGHHCVHWYERLSHPLLKTLLSGSLF